MVKAKHYFTCFFLLNFFVSFSQMPGTGGNLIYGNEWIEYDNTYYRFLIAEDGWYSLDYNSMVASGVEPEEIIGSRVRLYRNGQEIPVKVSTDGGFGENDTILFYGLKNRSELERFMFKNPDNQLLNPRYSMFSDSSAYFLTFSDEGTGKRFEDAGEITPTGNSTDQVIVKKAIVTSGAFYSEAPSAVINPDFEDLEGFSGAFKQEFTLEMDIDPEEIKSDSVYLRIRTAADLRTRKFEVMINGKVVSDVVNENVQLAGNLEYSLPVQEIDGSVEVALKCEKGSEKVSIPFIEAMYTVSSDALGSGEYSTFEIESGNQSPREISLTNITAEFVYDVHSGTEYRIVNNNNNPSVVLRNPENAVFSIPIGIHRVSKLQKRKFENYLETDFNYLIISNSALRKDENGGDAVQEYADYRSSAQGGGYQVRIANIDQLRDQFIYGIDLHPFSIKNFVDKLLTKEKVPQFVTLIGKGISYGSLRSASDYAKYVNQVHFVPTFGHYGSDNLLVAEQWNPAPRIPIGRIPAISAEDVRNYLQKVKDYEMVQSDPGTVPDRSWMKKIMHFNGGDRSIYANIANFMDGIGDKIVRDTFAAKLISYYKSSFGTTDSPEREEIFQQINEGTALITFLGHSASSALDFEIDNISEYQNEGKLPVFMALGCSSGNIFLTNVNLAERFVLTKGTGSIVFLSTASSQYLTNLQKFARIFYGKFGGEQYGDALGRIIKSTHEDMGRPQDQLISIFTFCGDPAISAYRSDGPDFRLSTTKYDVEPQRPSLLDDYLTMTFTVENWGKKYRDSVVISIEQQLPSGDRIIIDTVNVAVNNYEKEFSIRVPMRDDMEGSNIFYLQIDPDNVIEEFPSGVAEQNNELVFPGQAGLEVYVRNSAMQLVYPYNNSIIPSGDPTLRIFNGNIEKDARTYVIEFDTVPDFGSGFGRTFERMTASANIDIDPELELKENLVYYWRARIKGDSLSTPVHSFTYIDGETGWNQSHYGQFSRDSLVELMIAGNDWTFSPIHNSYNMDHGYKKPGTSYNESGAARYTRAELPGFNVAIFKPNKNDFVENPYPGIYKSVHRIERDGALKTFPYRPYVKEQRIAIIDLINIEADEGDYVIFWNTTRGSKSPEGENWARDSIDNNGINLFNYFESNGAKLIRSLEQEDRRTYSLVYKKGGEVISERLDDSATVVSTEVILESFLTQGQLIEDEIRLLSSIDFVKGKVNTKNQDSTSSTFYYTTVNGRQEVDWQNSEFMDNLEVSGVKDFGFQVDLVDDFDRSPPQIQYLQVLGGFRPDIQVSNLERTPLVDEAGLKAGEIDISYRVSFDGNIEGDSVDVVYEVIGQNVSWKKKSGIGTDEGGTVKQVGFPIPENLMGDFILKITVDTENKYEEANENNNSILTVVDLDRDRIPPKLEVLFDNQVIINGDIVSPKVKIVAEIVDLVNYNLDNPPNYTFEIKDPSGDILNISESDPLFELVQKDDRIELIYSASFTESGMYELTVNARDAANNTEDVDYTVNFEVITESSISRILPYPNPFTTSMRFAYTLTGAEEPEIFRIMIYTPSGRLVREITKAEFGPMRAGRHLSEYVWDGTDEHRQELAPGVYLYKIITRNAEGENYKKYNISELEDGGYFKSNIGKIVKLR